MLRIIGGTLHQLCDAPHQHFAFQFIPLDGAISDATLGRVLPAIRHFLRRQSPALAAVATLLTVGGLAAEPARAASSIDSVTVVNGDLVVDKTAVLAIAGNLDPAEVSSDRSLVVHINSPSLPCAATQALNRERELAQSDRFSQPRGPFTDSRVEWTPSAAGDFLLCAYLYDFIPDEQYALKQVAVSVRQPRTDLKLRLPSDRLQAGVEVPLEITAFAEVARNYTVQVNPIGVPCGPNASANQGTSLISERNVLGGPATTVENISTPEAGQYRLCGWVGFRSDDASPTTVVSEPTFWTGPPPKCRLGAAPKKATGRVKISCVSVDGSVDIQAKRGSKPFSTTVGLVSGVGYVGGRAIGLKRGKRVTVTVLQGGTKLGSRILKVKPAKKAKKRRR